jgi:O-antigen ligase
LTPTLAIALVVVLAAWTLGMTLTRGDMVAGVVAIGLVAAIPGLTLKRVAAMSRAAVLVGVLGLGAMFVVVPQAHTTPWSATAPRDTTTANIDSLISPRNLGLRVDFWRAFAKAIVDDPIVGYGTNSDGSAAVVPKPV